MKAHKWLDINIRIHSIDVCVRVVINVVFDSPEVGIATKNVKKVRRNIVHPLIF